MDDKKGSPFECLNAINEKNPTYKYSKKVLTAYMMLLWFSHSESCMPCVDKLNERLFDMPDELVYAAMYKGIPKGKRFLKWDKKTKDKAESKKHQLVIKELMDDHGFSEFEARTIFKRYIDV